MQILPTSNRRVAAVAAVVFAAILATAASPAPATDPYSIIVAAEEWLEATSARFDADPELREKRGSGWMPFSRSKWLLDARLVGGQMLDPLARWQAWEAKRARDLEAARAGDGAWFQLGPTRYSGRILGIEFHPSNPAIVYVGSASGGLWKSTDGGDSWSVLTDDLPNIAIGGLAVLPWAPEVVLIGTGEGTTNLPGLFGQGIFKSTDGGQTWNPTSLQFDPGSWTGFHVIEVQPETGVILAGSKFHLYRSTDEGDNWTSVSMGNWTDVKWKPGDPSHVYAARALVGGVYVSTDAGITWNVAGTGQPPGTAVDKTKLGVSPASPDVVYAHYSKRSTRESYGVYRSTDSGSTWEVRNNTTNMLGQQGNYNLSLVVDPDDVDHLISGGVKLYGSTDAGATWTTLDNGAPLGSATNPHVDNHAAIYEPGSSTNVWVGTDGGVWRSTDDGATWASRREGLVTYQFYDICVAQSDPAFMMGGTQDNGVPGREGTDTWFESTLTADGMVCNITPTNASEIYAEWQSGRHVKSTNGGHAWFPIQAGISGLGNFVTPVDQDQNDPDHLYTSADSGVYRTTNGGAFWEQVAGTEHAATWLSISPIDGDFVWSGKQTELRYTTDDGATWTIAEPYGFSHGSFLKVYAHPAELDAAFVLFGGYTPLAHIALTTDRGSTWTDVSGDLPVMPVNAIVIDWDDPQAWYVGTDVGVWKSTDGGDHWLPFGTELPNVVVMDLEIHRSTRKLVAGTYGRGAWEVNLAGQTSVADASSAGALQRLMLDPPLANPVRTRAVFRFAARSASPVHLDIYDVAGRKVARVTSLPRGDSVVRGVEWDARSVANGVYFVVLRAGSDRLAHRLVVAR